MKREQKSAIRFEVFEKTVIRFRRKASTRIFCRECRENATHFSVARAAAILSLTETAIFRAAESGQIHSTETAAGALLVCGKSLTNLGKEIQGVQN